MRLTWLMTMLLLQLAVSGQLVDSQAELRQTATLQEIDAYCARALRDWGVPGMAVAIVRDGTVILAKGYGVVAIGASDPVDEDTLFAVASNTKAFTSAALAILADEGKLGWDDRVIDHLPYFELADPAVTRQITIRDLLCHRSGLGTFSGDLIWYGTSYSREDVVRRVRFLKPVSSFRSQYAYSNVMFVTAGEVVSAVSGQSWDDFVRERLFEPLGMTRTVSSVDALKTMTNVATPHAWSDGHIVPYPWRNWDNAAAAGGIISSASDMARWLLLQLGHGALNGKTVFSESASRTMWTPYVSFSSNSLAQRNRSYGLGWVLFDYQRRKIVEHGGAYDGMVSRVTLVPDEGLGLVILTNSDADLSEALTYRLLDGLLDRATRDWSREGLVREGKRRAARDQRDAGFKRKQTSRTRPSLPLEPYIGDYAGNLYGRATVTLEDGQLVLRLMPNPELVADLTRWRGDTFVLHWRHRFPWFGDGEVRFLRRRNGSVTEMKLDVPNDDFWFDEPRFTRQ